jgi:hypothetical protein
MTEAAVWTQSEVIAAHEIERLRALIREIIHCETVPSDWRERAIAELDE